MLRLLAFLAALAFAWPALAAVPRISPSGPFTPGKGKSFLFVTGDSGETEAIGNACGAHLVSVEVATGGAFALYGCPTETDTTGAGCQLVGTWSADTVGALVQTAFPFLRGLIVTAPSSGTARATAYCSAR